jgi:hypothetical protein
MGDYEIVSDNVCDQLPNAERFEGGDMFLTGDKYERNIQVNVKFNGDFKSDSVCIATGEGFADALAGAAYCAKISEPMILINNNNESSFDTKSYYRQIFANANNINIFGGTGIISDTVVKGLNSSLVEKVW